MNHIINVARQKKILAIIGAIIVLSALAYIYRCGMEKVCGSVTVEQVVRSGKHITTPKGIVYAEVVDTPASRERGLSGRDGLGNDEGMLFVFEQPGTYAFWMKDMLFPIDIVWINEEGVVVHVERNVKPSSYAVTNPPQTYVNGPDARYVLELAEGKAEAYGLYLGVKVGLGE